MGQRELTALTYVRVKVFASNGFSPDGVRRSATAFGAGTTFGAKELSCDVTQSTSVANRMECKSSNSSTENGLEGLECLQLVF